MRPSRRWRAVELRKELEVLTRWPSGGKRLRAPDRDTLCLRRLGEAGSTQLAAELCDIGESRRENMMRLEPLIIGLVKRGVRRFRDSLL